MENKNAKIFVSSVSNYSKRLEHYGDANLENISLLKLIYKYACYSTTYAQLQRLNSMVISLQMNDPLICIESQASRGYVDPNLVVPVFSIGDDTNSAPTILDGDVEVENATYTFSESDMFSGYSDPNGDPRGNFTIKSLPLLGSLTYNGSAVTINTLYQDPSLLVFERNSNNASTDSFNYSVFDNNSQLPLESNTATISIDILEIQDTNQPATVGDRARYSGNRATTVFGSADFTTEAIAPYFDPEGNELDAIRIEEVSDANTGIYYYFGNPVSAGQVITKSELDLGALYHVAPDENAITTDSFRVSVRDTGSMIWVQ
tara:strand:+ start:791 stop:1744 length:954 start_codon:yes stop_codon:yes gene_type:complete